MTDSSSGSMAMSKHNLFLQIDTELHAQAKSYAEEKNVPLSRLISELLLGLLSRESKVGEELRKSIEVRLDGMEEANGRIAVLHEQEKIRQEREQDRERKQEAREERQERRRRERAAAAHARKIELEKVKLEARLKLDEERRRVKEQNAAKKKESAQDGYERMRRSKELDDPECIRCGSPRSQCQCPEEALEEADVGSIRTP